MPNTLDLDQATPNIGRSPTPELTKPGIHSYNLRRRTRGNVEDASPRHASSWMRRVCLFVGLACVGYYAFTLADDFVYQRYQNWAFDRQIAGRHAAVTTWLMETTPLGRWTGYQESEAPSTAEHRAEIRSAPEPSIPKPAYGSILGRVAVPRLGVRSVVREGADDDTLRRAVGHVPSTQLPGDIGNFAIAAHRDTLFRALKDVRIGDRVTFESPRGTFDYSVISTRIVRPSDVSVLNPQGDQKLLTMITCYPFFYVGAAPKRFIVTARLDKSSAAVSPASGTRTGPVAMATNSQSIAPPLSGQLSMHQSDHSKRFARGTRSSRSASHIKTSKRQPQRSRLGVPKRSGWYKLNPFRTRQPG